MANQLKRISQDFDWIRVNEPVSGDFTANSATVPGVANRPSRDIQTWLQAVLGMVGVQHSDTYAVIDTDGNLPTASVYLIKPKSDGSSYTSLTLPNKDNNVNDIRYVVNLSGSLITINNAYQITELGKTSTTIGNGGTHKFVWATDKWVNHHHRTYTGVSNVAQQGINFVKAKPKEIAEGIYWVQANPKTVFGLTPLEGNRSVDDSCMHLIVKTQKSNLAQDKAVIVGFTKFGVVLKTNVDGDTWGDPVIIEKSQDATSTVPGLVKLFPNNQTYNNNFANYVVTAQTLQEVYANIAKSNHVSATRTDLDPNTTLDKHILTTHQNCPAPTIPFWVTTTFFGTATQTANRSQLAVSATTTVNADYFVMFGRQYNATTNQWLPWRLLSLPHDFQALLANTLKNRGTQTLNGALEIENDGWGKLYAKNHKHWGTNSHWRLEFNTNKEEPYMNFVWYNPASDNPNNDGTSSARQPSKYISFPTIKDGTEHVAYQSWVRNAIKDDARFVHCPTAGTNTVETVDLTSRNSVEAWLGDRFINWQYRTYVKSANNDSNDNWTGLPLPNRAYIVLTWYANGYHTYLTCEYPGLGRMFHTPFDANRTEIELNWKEYVTADLRPVYVVRSNQTNFSLVSVTKEHSQSDTLVPAAKLVYDINELLGQVNTREATHYSSLLGLLRNLGGESLKNAPNNVAGHNPGSQDTGRKNTDLSTILTPGWHHCYCDANLLETAPTQLHFPNKDHRELLLQIVDNGTTLTQTAVSYSNDIYFRRLNRKKADDTVVTNPNQAWKCLTKLTYDEIIDKPNKLNAFGITDFENNKRLGKTSLNAVTTNGIYQVVVPETAQECTTLGYPDQAYTADAVLFCFGGDSSVNNLIQIYSADPGSLWWRCNDIVGGSNWETLWTTWKRLDGADWDEIRGRPTSLEAMDFTDFKTKNLKDEDLDTIKTPGMYSQQANVRALLRLNYPDMGGLSYDRTATSSHTDASKHSRAGVLLVLRSNPIKQIYYDWSSSLTFSRHFYNGSWSPWEHHSNGCLPLTGGIIDGLTVIRGNGDLNNYSQGLILNSTQSDGGKVAGHQFIDFYAGGDWRQTKPAAAINFVSEVGYGASVQFMTTKSNGRYNFNLDKRNVHTKLDHSGNIWNMNYGWLHDYFVTHGNHFDGFQTDYWANYGNAEIQMWRIPFRKLTQQETVQHPGKTYVGLQLFLVNCQNSKLKWVLPYAYQGFWRVFGKDGSGVHSVKATAEGAQQIDLNSTSGKSFMLSNKLNTTHVIMLAVGHATW